MFEEEGVLDDMGMLADLADMIEVLEKIAYAKGSVQDGNSLRELTEIVFGDNHFAHIVAVPHTEARAAAQVLPIVKETFADIRDEGTLTWLFRFIVEARRDLEQAHADQVNEDEIRAAVQAIVTMVTYILTNRGDESQTIARWIRTLEEERYVDVIAEWFERLKDTLPAEEAMDVSTELEALTWEQRNRNL
ncbi:MAG: hypothetical protein Q4A71_02825 [Actinomycetaceae bacterium]|nr:hypothetical protein [Actinomycetaceae bacterium]